VKVTKKAFGVEAEAIHEVAAEEKGILPAPGVH
jgi:hypothetical protein